MMYIKRIALAAGLFFLASSLLFAGCSNLTPVNPQNPPTPSKQLDNTQDYTVTYNYGDTGPVQLSANNFSLKVGQRLILKPAPGLTKNTRFTSGNGNFFGDIMQQEGDQSSTGQLSFRAKQAGKGKLQIIPNGTDTDRATDLWVTVE
ncbi:hypothetical protein [Sporomusa acidovorans]|uniref:Uncharacterized protein n=1 Tax=Sporomusa acidovorans (strain ATCC 49682 / DSM 3132 / Mol) TaxID=1123286 RepID=A0ABZ3J7Z8_SPOA4|nr:hypothetical protein [Sporomusa acidovorans]OZC17531.1 hypothetical protein SPACI_37770 [Sporomusa acidovorans DSM 3132]SDF08681.1 hypothetical protein SAMN04488499_103246 [Sporomusa acidovorans]